MDVEPLGLALSLARDSATGEAEWADGAVLNARVLKRLPEGGVRLSLADRVIDVATTVDLAPGTRIAVRVDRQASGIQLVVLAKADGAPATSAAPTSATPVAAPVPTPPSASVSTTVSTTVATMGAAARPVLSAVPAPGPEASSRLMALAAPSPVSFNRAPGLPLVAPPAAMDVAVAAVRSAMAVALGTGRAADAPTAPQGAAAVSGPTSASGPRSLPSSGLTPAMLVGLLEQALSSEGETGRASSGPVRPPSGAASGDTPSAPPGSNAATDTATHAPASAGPAPSARGADPIGKGPMNPPAVGAGTTAPSPPASAALTDARAVETASSVPASALASGPAIASLPAARVVGAGPGAAAEPQPLSPAGSKAPGGVSVASGAAKQGVDGPSASGALPGLDGAPSGVSGPGGSASPGAATVESSPRALPVSPPAVLPPVPGSLLSAGTVTDSAMPTVAAPADPAPRPAATASAVPPSPGSIPASVARVQAQAAPVPPAESGAASAPVLGVQASPASAATGRAQADSPIAMPQTPAAAGLGGPSTGRAATEADGARIGLMSAASMPAAGPQEAGPALASAAAARAGSGPVASAPKGPASPNLGEVGPPPAGSSPRASAGVSPSDQAADPVSAASVRASQIDQPTPSGGGTDRIRPPVQGALGTSTPPSAPIAAGVGGTDTPATTAGASPPSTRIEAPSRPDGVRAIADGTLKASGAGAAPLSAPLALTGVPGQGPSPDRLPDLKAALNEAVSEAVGGQASLAPLLARAQALVEAAPAAMPRPVLDVLAHLIGLRLPITPDLDAARLRSALRQSGPFLEARQAASGEERPPGDLKAALVEVKAALAVWLGERTGRDPGLAERLPPPRRGELAPAQAAPSVSLPRGPLDALGHQLQGDTDGALDRLLLTQYASLDAVRDPQGTRPEAAVALKEWQMELPVLIGRETHVVPFQVTRDRRRRPDASGPETLWRVRFALATEPLGPIVAQITLTEGRDADRRIAVALWADRPASVEVLRRTTRDLRDALDRAGLVLDEVACLGGTPDRPEPVHAAIDRRA